MSSSLFLGKGYPRNVIKQNKELDIQELIERKAHRITRTSFCLILKWPGILII